jgi:TRAP-type C4-dicarboxylate transport system substrate-binding protein
MTKAATLATAMALALGAGPAAAQQFTLKMSAPTANDVSTEWMAAAKKGIETRSGGKIKVELYPANQLGQLPATIEGVALGTIEMTLPAVGFLAGLEPRYGVFEVPGLFDSIPHAMQVLTDPDIRRRLSTFGASKGVESVVTYVNGPLVMASHKPVRAIADFKGQKIRAPGGAPIQMEPLKKLGALPVSMPLGEVLPALQTRAIDGTYASFSVFTSFKYFDVVKNATVLPNSFLVATGVMNKGWLKSIGPDLEAIVREEFRKNEPLFWTYGVEDLARIQKTWQQNGGQAYTFAPPDAARYVKEAIDAVAPVINANPQIKEDYAALLQVAAKYRKAAAPAAPAAPAAKGGAAKK